MYAPNIQTELLICQQKANLDVKILFGKINHLPDQESRKML